MRRLLLVLMFLTLFAFPAFAQTAFDFPNTPTANQIVTGPSNQQFQWDGRKWVALLNAGVGGGFTAGGDLSGTSTAQTVIGIQTKAVPAPASGYLHYNGTAFLWDTPAGGSGGGIAEAPTDGNAYLRANSAWTSGGTIANDIIVSAVHLTNLSGWAPINFGNPNLAAGTSGAVTASLFAYNAGAGGNNNLNITAGSHMWNGNWVSDTPTAEAIVMNPTSISFQYSTGNTVGATLGTWNSIANVSSTGLNLQAGNYQYNGTAIGGTCTAGQYVSALSGHGVITCGTPAGGGGGIAEAPTDGNAYMRASSAWSSGGTLVNPLTTPTLHLTNETSSSLMWPHGSISELGSASVPYIEFHAGGYYNGSQFIATSTSVLSMEMYANAINFGYSSPGVGNAYSPAIMATIGASGINLPTGENFMINGVAIGGGGVTSITAGTGLTGGTITTTGTISLNLANANTWTAVQTFSSAPVMSGASITAASIPMTAMANSGVTAAAYTNANITVNAQGIVTVAANGTAGASLSGTNTWTANNTFPNTGLLVKGTTGSSATTLAATGTGSTQYTATFPGNTGTVAELNLAQTWTATQTFPAASIGVAALTGILPIANGGTSTGTAPSSGQILIAQSATSYLPETASLDATINPNGQMVVVGIRGNTIPGLVANTYLHYTSGGTFVWDTPGGGLTAVGPTSFTPTIYFGGANVGIAYSGQQGSYYQVGKLTLITYQIQLSNKGTSTGGAQMCGLPFPAYTSGNHQGDFPVYAASGFTGLTATLALHLPSGNSCVTLVQTTGAQSYSGAITDANMTNTSFFYGSFIYEAN